MDQQDERVKTALFRFGAIAPLVCRKGDDEQMKMLKQTILTTPVEFPDGSSRLIPERTLRHWLQRYQKKGFDGLFDGRRSDRGECRKISTELLERAEALRREQPSRSVKKLISLLRKEGLPTDGLAERTLARHLARLGATKERLKKGAGSYQRWEQDFANDLWQGDTSHGVWLRDPYNPKKAKKTKLIVFIDDASRTCPHAEFYFNEQLPSLVDCFGKALLKRGRPCRMLFDNAWIYHSTTLATMSAELGIEISFCRPRAPQGKGKVERFIRTIQESFFNEAARAGVETLEELNTLFQAWLSKEYHERIHSELDGKTPIERWKQDIQRISLVTQEELRRALLLRVKRVVQPNTSTVSIEGRDYQVSTKLAGQEVEIRWNPEFIDNVEVWLFGEFVETASLFHIKNYVEKPQSPDEEPCPGSLPSSQLYLQSLVDETDEQQDIVKLRATQLLTFAELQFQIQQCTKSELDPSGLTRVKQLYDRFAPMYREDIMQILNRAVSVKGAEMPLRFYLEQLEAALNRR